MRILMGTYALSAGYYDAYYKRAQQVTFRKVAYNEINIFIILPLNRESYIVVGEDIS
jgi:Asp-tRNA(Asn)/Glu-tRNA(Gln) amidotransferase A subunit family amidase